MGKNISGFKLACTNYFSTLNLGLLRSYGRSLNLRNPTTLKKADLIEELIKVLCGEINPIRNNKGAPIKGEYVDKSIFEKVTQFQREYLCENRDDYCGGECKNSSPAANDGLQEILTIIDGAKEKNQIPFNA